MFESLFTGVLTLGLMISGVVAFAADFQHSRQHAATAAVQVVTLPTVTIVAHRRSAATQRIASL